MFWHQIYWLCDEDDDEYAHIWILLNLVRVENWPHIPLDTQG